MFAPPIAKPKSKTAEPQRATVVTQKPSHSAVEQAHLLQRSIGNQAVLRLLAQRASLTRNEPGAQEREADAARAAAQEAAPSWDFSKVPAYSPGREKPFQMPPGLAPRLPIQAKLKVGAVDDPLEHEADRVADQVMSMSAPGVPAAAAPPQVSRKCDSCEKEEEKLQSKEAGPQAATGEAPAIVHEVLRSPGQPLDPATRAYFEPRFGHDFSRVRVHADSLAAASAGAVGALAYAVGQRVVFGTGQFTPHNIGGRRLLAHELAHVAQQANGARVLARQMVEQYETKGIPLDVSEAGKWAARSYWEQKVLQIFDLAEDSRMLADAEERDAVLAALWQVRPTTAITSETTKVVRIPKRAAAAASKDIVYQIIFTPRKKPTDKDHVVARFAAEGAATTPVTAAAPSVGFTPQQPSLSHSGFPGNDIDKYWKAHPEEEQRVFSWIQTSAAQTFDQVVSTSVTSVTRGSATRSASFHVKGTKDASGNITSLTITFLGATAPATQAVPAGYASHDYADLQIEEAQTIKDPKKADKLGTINGVLSTLPPAEQLSAKFAIWQYFKGGTRNAEVDAIVPIANTTKRVLYTFRFKPKTNDVDVQRIGEEGKEVSLAAQGDLGRVNGFTANSKDVPTLMAWLKKRYPGVTPTGTTIDDVQKSVSAQIQAKSGTPAWHMANYGIEILDATAAAARLQLAHKLKPPQLADLQDFTPTELQVLEITLETMSDSLVATFMGLKMARQKIRIKAEGKPVRFAPNPQQSGLTLTDGADRTIIIFDAASLNAAALFVGGIGPGGKPAVEVETAMTFAHELGHTVANQPSMKKAFDDFVKAKKIKPVTWYAASNPPSELFPESFALYFSDPEWLKQNWPDLYRFFFTLDKTGKAPP
jgi:hypothetical protein